MNGKCGESFRGRFCPLTGDKTHIKMRVADIKLIINAATACENDEYHNGALLALYFSTNANESFKNRC